MRDLMIFGSTGSIGRSTLDIIRRDRKNFKVKGLMVNKNIALLQKQIKEFIPSYVCVADERKAGLIKDKIPRGINFFYGPEGVREFSSVKSDISVMGIVGISSLEPLLINLPFTKRMALASKEPLVVAGGIVKEAIKDTGAELIPVDSEINALFQLFQGVKREYVSKVYLTASGGPLLECSREDLKRVTVCKVLSHPTWKMGARISVDSATLVNKAFEVMETHFLFDMDYNDIEIVIHRQSQVHALLQMRDYNFLACLYPPDMRLPLAFSLYYPFRYSFGEGKFPFYNKSISFEKVNLGKFPLLSIVLEAAKRGDNFPVVVNAADEVAIKYFLGGKIKFYDIYRVVREVYRKVRLKKVNDFADVIYWDGWARQVTEEVISKCG